MLLLKCKSKMPNKPHVLCTYVLQAAQQHNTPTKDETR